MRFITYRESVNKRFIGSFPTFMRSVSEFKGRTLCTNFLDHQVWYNPWVDFPLMICFKI